MKQLLVLSGKGGTGKTTLSSAFIELSGVKAFADCDVDAPNLHLVTNHLEQVEAAPYEGLPKAFIQQEHCIQCGKCFENCRFKAIIHDEVGYKVNALKCEGCGLCEVLCPTKAMVKEKAVVGETKLYQHEERVFSTATLKMGSGTTGKLVSQVKKNLREKIKDSYQGLIIIDGSPGIGCPVIASISGVDLVLVVAEPSASGLHDMKRILETAKHLQVKCVVCINKYTMHLGYTELIEGYCEQEGIAYVGKIPFDKEGMRLINEGKTVVARPTQVGQAIEVIYNQLLKIINQEV